LPRRRSQALNLTEIRLRLNENNAGVKRQRVEEHGEAGTLVAREGESHRCWNCIANACVQQTAIEVSCS